MNFNNKAMFLLFLVLIMSISPINAEDTDAINYKSSKIIDHGFYMAKNFKDLPLAVKYTAYEINENVYMYISLMKKGDIHMSKAVIKVIRGDNKKIIFGFHYTKIQKWMPPEYIDEWEYETEMKMTPIKFYKKYVKPRFHKNEL